MVHRLRGQYVAISDATSKSDIVQDTEFASRSSTRTPARASTRTPDDRMPMIVI